MTHKKTILAVSLAAVFAIGVISLPAFAADFGIPHLTKTKLTIDGDKYSKIEFKTDDKIPKDGGFLAGYAILTGGDVIAVTSHQGAFDSETQTFPVAGATFGLCEDDEVAAGFCGPVWHSHLVTPTGDTRCATGLAIGGLTHEEPTKKVKVKGDKITLEKIPLGTSMFTESVSNTVGTPFTAALPVDGDAVTGEMTPEFNGLEFPLVPVDTKKGFGICIGPADPGFDSLCADLGTGTNAEAQAYKLLVGGGGPNNKIDIDEFLYSDALWNEINTATGDVVPEGLGGNELENWYALNC